MRSTAGVCSAAALVLVAACGPRHSTVRVAPDQKTEISDRWNDTDARLTAEALIPKLLNGVWLTKFDAAEQRPPAIRVRNVVNKSAEHIDAQLFIKLIEKALLDSGRIKVLAQAGAELGSVHEEQAYGLGETVAVDKAAGVGKETGADFVLTVRLATVIDQLDGQRMKLFKIDMELTDATSGEKAWMDAHEIKKVSERAKSAF